MTKSKIDYNRIPEQFIVYCIAFKVVNESDNLDDYINRLKSSINKSDMPSLEKHNMISHIDNALSWFNKS